MTFKAIRWYVSLITVLLLGCMFLIIGCCKPDVVKVVNQATFGKSDNEQANGITPLGNNQFAITGTIRDGVFMTGIISGGAPPVIGRLYNFTPTEMSSGGTSGLATIQNSDGKIITVGNQGFKLPILYSASRENDKPEIQGLTSLDVIRFQQVKDIIQLRDQSYLITGYVWKDIDNRQQDVMVTRISSDLTRVIWSNSYGASGYEAGEKAIEMKNGNILIAGITNSLGSGNEDILLLQLDLQGKMLGAQIIGTPFSDNTPRPIKSNNDIFLTFNYDHPDNADIIVAKLDAGLNINWSKRYGTPSRDLSRSSIQSVSGGGIVIAGGTINDNNYGTSYDAMMLRIEEDGRIAWGMAYGGCSMDVANAVCSYNSDGYLLAGSAESFSNNSDIYVLKTDLSGKTFLNDLDLKNLSVNDVVLTSDNNVTSKINTSFLSNTLKSISVLTDNGNLTGATQPSERKPCN